MEQTFSPCPYCDGKDNNCAGCELQAYRAIIQNADGTPRLTLEELGELGDNRPPCRVGDTVYGCFSEDGKKIFEAQIVRLRHIFYLDGHTCFVADVEYEIVDPYYNDGRKRLCGAFVGIETKYGGQTTAYLTREAAEAAKEGRDG